MKKGDSSETKSLQPSEVIWTHVKIKDIVSGDVFEIFMTDFYM